MSIKIYKRGDIYHYRGTVNGRRLRGSTKTGEKATAERIAAEIQSRAWQSSLDGPGAVLTFSEAVVLYSKAGRPVQYLEKLVLHWETTRIKEISAGAIRQCAIDLFPNASAATRNRQVITPMQAIINHCADLELCSPIRVKRYPVEKKQVEEATYEWVQSFMEHASPHLGAMALFMFLTRSRVSEAVSLDWHKVDLNAATAWMRSTKIGVEEKVNLPPELVVALANIPGERSGPVFKYKSRHSIQKAWATAEANAGIPHRKPHSMCHGFATGLLRSGVDPVTVAELGRWKSARHVLETYGHAMKDKTLNNMLVGTKLTQPENEPLPDTLENGGAEGIRTLETIPRLRP